MALYRYLTDKNGSVRSVLVREKPRTRGEHALAVLPFEERVRKAFYGLECEHGSRWNRSSEYSTSTLKRVWANEAT